MLGVGCGMPPRSGSVCSSPEALLPASRLLVAAIMAAADWDDAGSLSSKMPGVGVVKCDR